VSGASASTATATTATASGPGPARDRAAYVGRFAPSPTGRLHLGSLLAALGSFLDARHAHGRWLVRMEDLDSARVVPGCAAQILRTLEAFGLEWDGEVLYQSGRLGEYGAALERLRAAGLTFECSCSRRARAAGEDRGYPGTCRGGPRGTGPTATRLRIDRDVRFEDRLQGEYRMSARQLGDVIIRRRDGVYAYQLAVVVDDAAQAVTDVVRGCDLIDSTGWQLELQRALALPQPRYAHLPLVVESGGEKLAKARRSVPLEPRSAGPLLYLTLELLAQRPPPELARATPAALLAWAIPHWNPAALKGVRRVRAPPAGAGLKSR